MQHRYRIVFCHIDFIQYAKPTVFRTLIDASFSQFDLIIFKGIRSYQITASCVDMEGNVISGSLEDPCQILRQNIFSGGFGTGK